MNKAELAELLARGHPYGREGKYHLFKISVAFDSIAKNSQWRGNDVKSLAKMAPVMK